MSGAEIGVERAENRMIGSGAVSRRVKIRWSRRSRSGDWAEMAAQSCHVSHSIIKSNQFPSFPGLAYLNPSKHHDRHQVGPTSIRHAPYQPAYVDINAFLIGSGCLAAS